MKKKVLWFIVGLLFMLLIAMIIFMLVYTNMPATKSKEQLELGQKYLEELEYEEAIAAFNAAIEIEPKNANAYMGLADVYVAMGDLEGAIEVLQTGYTATRDREVSSYLKELEKELYKEEADLDISQIDTGEFPQVTLYFSLQDENGDYIVDAAADQIKVYEGTDDEWSEVSGELFGMNEDSAGLKSVAFVMDVSGSMGGSIDIECDAARSLLRQMESDGNYRASLIAFDNSWWEICGYTDNISQVEAGLSEMSAGGGTALYDTLKDTLYNALDEDGQKYIVAFTDGEDGSYSTTKEELTSLATYYKIPIYIIVAGNGNISDMTTITEGSGGKLYQISSVDGLSEIYNEIFEIQQNLYSYTYSTSSNNEWRDVRIVYSTEDYTGEDESEMLAQKPVWRELLSNDIISDYSASAQDESGSSYSYDSSVSNVFDGWDDTYWEAGGRNDGIGECLEIYFDGYYELNGVELVNGIHDDLESYEKNNRVKTVKLTFSDGTSQTYDLNDDYWGSSTIDFAVQVKTTSLKIEIVDVYKGLSYRRTYIGEVSIY